MAAKTAAGIDIERKYVTVNLCILYSEVKLYKVRQSWPQSIYTDTQSKNNTDKWSK